LIGSDLEDIASEIAIYKSLRPIIAGASTTLLSGQAGDGAAWDVLQLTSGFQVVIAAVRGQDSIDGFVVRPVGLDPAARYEVTSMDFGVVGYGTGEELMTGGIDLYASPVSAAHLLVISPQAEPTPPPAGATARP
jgi:alpha-galactosidase